MNGPSRLTDVLFVLIVVMVAAFLGRALLRTARADVPGGGGGRSPSLLVVAAILAASLVVPGVLAGAGLLDRYSPMPAPRCL